MSIELAGARCAVRRFVSADAASIASVANDRRIWLQLRDLFPHPYRIADAEAYVGRVGSQDPPRSLAIAVEGRAVGGVGLQLMTDVNRRTAEIGYWLGADYWGRGIATEAVTLVTDWAFGVYGLLRIFAQPFAGNLASRRVLEKAGYQLEGTLRCSAVKDGEVRDQCIYARLSPGRTLPVTPVPSAEDHALLTRLEEAMWIEATRFDGAFMHDALAPDFFEFGKSGCRHTRDTVLGAARRAIDTELPLQEFRIRLLDENTAQITYITETGSAEGRLLARRSSIWSRTSQGWQLRFHQGTPIPP